MVYVVLLDLTILILEGAIQVGVTSFHIVWQVEYGTASRLIIRF